MSRAVNLQNSANNNNKIITMCHTFTHKGISIFISKAYLFTLRAFAYTYTHIYICMFVRLLIRIAIYCGESFSLWYKYVALSAVTQLAGNGKGSLCSLFYGTNIHRHHQTYIYIYIYIVPYFCHRLHIINSYRFVSGLLLHTHTYICTSVF